MRSLVSEFLKKWNSTIKGYWFHLSYGFNLIKFEFGSTQLNIRLRKWILAYYLLTTIPSRFIGLNHWWQSIWSNTSSIHWYRCSTPLGYDTSKFLGVGLQMRRIGEIIEIKLSFSFISEQVWNEEISRVFQISLTFYQDFSCHQHSTCSI